MLTRDCDIWIRDLIIGAMRPYLTEETKNEIVDSLSDQLRGFPKGQINAILEYVD